MCTDIDIDRYRHTHTHTHTEHTHTHIKLTSFSVPRQCVVQQEAANYIHADPRSWEAKEVEATSSLLETHNTHVDFTTMSGLYEETGAIGRNKVKWLSNTVAPEM
jgi:hypothetical protein